MAAQRGKDLLIKIGDGGDPETFTTVAGLRATTLSFNAQTVDITNNDSANMWRELLANSGVVSSAISGSGVFKDAASDVAIRSAFFNQDLTDWQIVIPSFGTVAGPFKVTQLQYDGPYNGELKLSLTLASAGALTFTGA
jgi:TP901-1 family phage major tail protein